MKEDSTIITVNVARLQKQLQELVRNINIGQSDERSSLLGRILTITDAAIAEPKQRQAVKDLVERAVYGTASPLEQSVVQWEIAQFAKAHGIDPLFEPESFNETTLPENRYIAIK